MSSNRKLTASEAHAWGLVDEVVEADALGARAAELAADYASRPTRGIGMTKRLFDHAEHTTLAEQLDQLRETPARVIEAALTLTGWQMVNGKWEM